MSDQDITIQFQPKPTNPRFKDLEGQVFNRLTVLGFAGKSKNNHPLWYCRCICGKELIAFGTNLLKNHTNSCGCFMREQASKAQKRHGESGNTPEHKAYTGAKARCENKNNKSYKYYGGRGIEFHFTSFEEFLAEVGRRPSPEHSLDRKKVNGHYEKGNVRWVTQFTQARNKRTNYNIIIEDETKCLFEWAIIYGLSPRTVWARVNTLGWCDECAVKLPLRHNCPHKTI